MWYLFLQGNHTIVAHVHISKNHDVIEFSKLPYKYCDKNTVLLLAAGWLKAMVDKNIE